ncbi:MAG: hypothetical protein CBD97_02370 [Pelagibacteraceae bacterium TMED237]|nr:MAG: hypothetical protein CBD97_02370 [Pelagibacteraceae bacterium TMED237]
MKKKVLVILSSRHYTKYLTLKSFQNLDKKFDVYFALKKGCYKKKNKFYFYKLNSNNKYILRYFDLIRLRSSKKIRSLVSPLLFRFPTFRYFKTIFLEKKHRFPFLVYLKSFFLKNIFYKILSSIFLFEIYQKFLFIKIKKKTGFETLIEKIDPRLIIYPTHYIEPDMIYINRSAQLINSKTFFIVDNWDNLTTKAAMLQKADYIGVWGEQSKKHAIKYYNFKSKNVFLLGNNRIDKYFKYRKKKYKNIIKIDKPYILFLGTNLLFREELKCLKILDEKINQNNLHSRLKIIYRFHPQLSEKFRSDFSEIRLKNIEINIPSSKFSHLGEKNLIRTKTQSKDYFPLIQNAKYLMGMTVTTVTLEGFIFGKNYILLDCFDEQSSHVSNVINKYSEYHKGIDKVEIFKRVKSYTDFFSFIKKKK